MTDLDQFRREKDEFFRQSPQSPLLPEQQASFTGLSYFPENPELRLSVEVSRFPEEQEVKVQTNTGDIQTYRRFGRFKLEVEGHPAELTIFEN
jgi:uncharacterized protein (DUF1684 family)